MIRALLVLLLLAAGCGAPAAPQQAPPVPVPVPAKHSRPSIARPLDTGAFADGERVCDLVPAAVRAGFGFARTQGSGEPGSGVYTCGVDLPDGYSVRLETGGDPLQRAYEMPPPGQKSSPWFTEELTVRGQPAARFQLFEDSDLCGVAVGLGESSGIEVFPSFHGDCATALALAEAAVGVVVAENGL